jgi:hypothetical protein
VSQRILSRSLGIALGLTNLLIRKLAREGFVRVINTKPNRVRYLVTPAGLAEKARISRRALQTHVRFYAEARNRIRERFARLSAEWPNANSNGEKRIVFIGAGEVAEIGYVCLQGTDLELVGVVHDDTAAKAFFGLPVVSYARLEADRIGGVPYDCVVVMAFDGVERIRKRLARRAIPDARVFYI